MAERVLEGHAPLTVELVGHRPQDFSARRHRPTRERIIDTLHVDVDTERWAEAGT